MIYSAARIQVTRREEKYVREPLRPVTHGEPCLPSSLRSTSSESLIGIQGPELAGTAWKDQRTPALYEYTELCSSCKHAVLSRQHAGNTRGSPESDATRSMRLEGTSASHESLPWKRHQESRLRVARGLVQWENDRGRPCNCWRHALRTPWPKFILKTQNERVLH